MAPQAVVTQVRLPVRQKQLAEENTTPTPTTIKEESSPDDYYYDIKDENDDIRQTIEPSPSRETFYISSYQRSLSWASNLSTITLETASTTNTEDHNSAAFTRRSSSASLTSAKLLKLMRPFSRSQERASSV